jgi:FRG domain
MPENETQSDPIERERQRGLEKGEAMKIIGDLIAGDKGRDIFRGQPRTGLPLLPKALRKEFKTGSHIEALSRFRRECWAFGLTSTNGLEDLAVAQHYGLATNLLDWTTNPLVALFFACGEAYDKDGTALGGDVFVLNNPEPVREEDIRGDRWMDIKGLKLYNPRLIDPRITRQKGLFTIQVEDKPVNDLVAHPELVMRFVPAELKQPLLEILYTMGIDRSTLFPDPDGLCARINWETGNRIKRDFPPVSGARVIYAQANVRIAAETETAASVRFRLIDSQKKEALWAEMENDLKTLETLISKSGQLPREAIKASWEILSKNVIETANLFGFRRDEGDGSDLKQAVYFLSLDVLGSQGLMTDLYALKAELEKIDKTSNAEDAQVFVRSCTTVLRQLLRFPGQPS